MLKFTMPKKLPPHRPKAFVHGSDMIVPTAERDVFTMVGWTKESGFYTMKEYNMGEQ